MGCVMIKGAELGSVGRNAEEEEAEISGMHVRLKCYVSLNLQHFQDRVLNTIIFVWLL